MQSLDPRFKESILRSETSSLYGHLARTPEYFYRNCRDLIPKEVFKILEEDIMTDNLQRIMKFHSRGSFFIAEFQRPVSIFLLAKGERMKKLAALSALRSWTEESNDQMFVEYRFLAKNIILCSCFDIKKEYLLEKPLY